MNESPIGKTVQIQVVNCFYLSMAAVHAKQRSSQRLSDHAIWRPKLHSHVCVLYSTLISAQIIDGYFMA